MPKQPQRPLDGAAHLLSREVAGSEVPVRLGGQHDAFRQAAYRVEHLAYAAFALPVTVGSGRVEEVDLAPQDGPQRLAGPLLVYREIEGLWHVPKRRASDAQRRDGESCTAQGPPRRGVNDATLHHSSRSGRYAPSAARRAAASVSSSAFSTLLLPRSASLIPSQMASSTAG